MKLVRRLILGISMLMVCAMSAYAKVSLPGELNLTNSIGLPAFPRGTDILSSEVTGCEKRYRHVWACAGRKPDGKISILLVNDGLEKASLELKGLEGKTFSYSYVVERITNQISKEADVSDTVNLSANSIVVLTEK